MNAKHRFVVVAVAFLLGGFGALGAARPAGGGAPTDAAGRPVVVEVPEGSSARTIGRILDAAGVVDARSFVDAVAVRGAAGALRAGTYELVTGMAAEDVVDALLAGSTGGRTVTLVEGATITDVLARLGGDDPAPWREALLSGAVVSPYRPDPPPAGVEPLQAWEGLLFPATYELSDDEAAATTLQRMADELVRRLDAADWSRIEALGVDRYGVLVVASLVEREARLDVDRPLVASVIYNRLEAGMPLQIDATVAYATGRRRLTAADLEVDSPYNTYRHLGLPPTPIGLVGEASLEAALHPARTEYLYYVVVGEDGRHGFSRTLEEHREKIRDARARGVLP